MTPLASRLFRQGDAEVQRSLAQAQFFEVSTLYDMASEMLAADVDAGALAYSEMAQLPAPVTVLEFWFGAGRVMVQATQEDNHIRYLLLAPVKNEHLSQDGDIDFVFEAGFHLGSEQNDDVQWVEPLLRNWAKAAGAESVEAFGKQQATGLSGTIEKLLCILNQPGLVDRQPRAIDKRIERAASAARIGRIPPAWHQCRIRPGQHGEGTGEGAEHQLHYVRKHFKPSIGKWIDGYWRGNADLGIYLKWYSTGRPDRPRHDADMVRRKDEGKI